ncbi:MAG TPA: PAS domain S-box protein, partial [Kofleriaceae bacterium]|nr:PAS domain S-box protein [Kofleriaceae bacterium]
MGLLLARAGVSAGLAFAVVVALVGLHAVLGGPPGLGEWLLPVAAAALVYARGRTRDAARVRARSQQELDDSQRHFAIAFDASPLPSAIIRTADLRIVSVNDAAVRWLGMSRERLLRATLHDLGVAPDDLARVIAELDRSGRVMRSTVAFERGGERRSVSVFGDRITVDDASHTFVVLEDVTERAAAEQARRESEARFAAAFEACPLPYAMMQMSDRTLIAVNDAFATFFGYTRDELVGRPDVHDFYANPVERDLARTLILREGRAHDLPLEMRRRDGTVRKVLASIETVTIGGVLYGMAVFADVTEKEEAERELRATQELFSRVFSASPLARSIVRADDLAYVEVNDAYVELLGYSYEELAG